MPETTGEVVATPRARLPFKVVFRLDLKVIAESEVTSELAGRELIAALLPTLRKFEND